MDGRRSVLFANGTRKQQFPDGHTTIRFTNRDIKRFFPCGRLPGQSDFAVIGVGSAQYCHQLAETIVSLFLAAS